MQGRSRAYALAGSTGRGKTAISVAFNDRCDMVVATAVVPHDRPAAIEPGVIAFLNSRDGPALGRDGARDYEDAAYPRTNHTSSTPRIADAIPTMRSGPSAVSSTCAIAFFAADGLTAKISPSITNTRPSATMKSAMRDNRNGAAGERGAAVTILAYFFASSRGLPAGSAK